MFKKGLIVLIFILFVSVIGAAGYLAMEQKEKEETKDLASAPIAKLVYTGTNETLSEALYHMDLQDGKLDEPHVVVTIEKIKPSDRYKSKRTKFINKDNKVIKEIIFPYNYDIEIYKDIGCVSVMEKVPHPEYNELMARFHFYDLNGKLLWQTEVAPLMYKVFAGPHYFSFFWPAPGFSKTINVHDAKGKEINVIDIDEKNEAFSEDGVAVSPNRKLVLFVFMGKEKYRFVVLDKKGKVVSSFFKSSNIGFIRDLSISDEGQIVFRGIYKTAPTYAHLLILNITGEITYKDDGRFVGLSSSSNNKYILIERRVGEDIDLRILNTDSLKFENFIKGSYFGIMVDNYGGFFCWLINKNSTDPDVLYYSFEGKTIKVLEDNYKAVGRIIFDQFRSLWEKDYFVMGDPVGVEWEDYVSFLNQNPVYGRINIYQLIK